VVTPSRARRRRYIVCYNEADARNDAAARAATLAGLEKALRQGDKALVGNKGFRQFLRTEGNSHFAIDPERVAAAAKFDGIYVIRTNAQISPLAVALRYRERWIVEDIFPDRENQRWPAWSRHRFGIFKWSLCRLGSSNADAGASRREGGARPERGPGVGGEIHAASCSGR
jgi:hypothetical protein